MIQLFGLEADGRLVHERVENLEQLSRDLVLRLTPLWLNLESPSASDLRWLGEIFKFHPLALEDCAHFDQRTKLEQYQDHLFLVVHGLLSDTEGLSIYELHCFLSNKVVVTVHEGLVVPIQSVMERLTQSRESMPAQVDFLLHRIMDSVMDANPEVLRKIEEEVEALDEAAVDGAETLHIERIMKLQRQLSRARHVLTPQRDLFAWMANRTHPQISEKAALYFRDIHDHSVRVVQQIEQMRDSLTAIREAHLSLAAYKTNEAMKRLTIFSVIFLPLTFVTGFFGMNFTAIPWGSEQVFDGLMVGILLVPVVMLLWFSRKDWI